MDPNTPTTPPVTPPVTTPTLSQTVQSNVVYQQPAGQFNSKDAVQSYLKDFQGALPKVRGEDINPATGKAYAVNPASGAWDDNYFAQNFGNRGKEGEEAAKLVDSLLPDPSKRPLVPSMLGTYENFRAAYGIESLEGQMTDLQTARDALVAEERIRVNGNGTPESPGELNKRVSMGVIAGRVGEVERQSAERIDTVDRQLASITRVYTAKMNTIQTLMTLTGQDYDRAKADYDTQFSQAIQTIDLIRGLRQDQITEEQRKIDNARADLQIMANALEKGATINDAQKAQMSNLEVQAGLPVGFISSIPRDPKSDIIFTSTDNGITQVGIRNSDGSISVQKYGTSTKTGGGKLTAAEQTQDRDSKTVQMIKSKANPSGHVDPATWNYYRDAYIESGGTVERFKQQFSGFTDPYRPNFAADYGFGLDERGVKTATPKAAAELDL